MCHINAFTKKKSIAPELNISKTHTINGSWLSSFRLDSSQSHVLHGTKINLQLQKILQFIIIIIIFILIIYLTAEQKHTFHEKKHEHF